MITVKSILNFCDTADDGQQLFSTIKNAQRTDKTVVISFHDCLSVTPSFVNVAFVQLLDDMSFDDIKKRIKLVDCTPQIGDMIKIRLTREAEKLVPA